MDPALKEVRLFTDDAIQKQIDRALTNVKPGSKGAVIAYGDLNGAHLTVVGKIGDHWSIVGNVNHSFVSKATDFHGAIRFEW